MESQVLFSLHQPSHCGTPSGRPGPAQCCGQPQQGWCTWLSCGVALLWYFVFFFLVLELLWVLLLLLFCFFFDRWGGQSTMSFWVFFFSTLSVIGTNSLEKHNCRKAAAAWRAAIPSPKAEHCFSACASAGLQCGSRQRALENSKHPFLHGGLRSHWTTSSNSLSAAERLYS